MATQTARAGNTCITESEANQMVADVIYDVTPGWR